VGRRRNVVGNQRLTATLGALLLLVLAAETLTLVSLGQLLAPHIVIGVLLIPLVIAKLATTGYRFLRYYTNDPAYRAKGPPPLFLRATAPFTALLTVAVLATGVLLILDGHSSGDLVFIHKVSVIALAAFIGIHVLGHLRELPSAAADWRRAAPAAAVAGSSVRIFLIATVVAAGTVLGFASLSLAHSWLG
jgi:hypothetical protein